MRMSIKQKRPISFGIKVAVVIVASSIVLGGIKRFTSNDVPISSQINVNNYVSFGAFNNILIPTIELPVSLESPEKDWTDALAKKLNGQSEVGVDRGRIDVMTGSYAIEIDFIKKWHEGLGQAIHYGDDSNRIGVLALIVKQKDHDDELQMQLLKKIERLCIKKGIKLVLLSSLSK